MKRIVGVILSFVLFSTNIVAAQTPSDIFSNDYQGEAHPFTNSGFQNRWIEMMLTEYDLSFDDLKTEENYYYFELDEALKVAFEESFIGSGDSVIFKLSIFDNEKTDFETIMNLVSMFDNEVDEAAIEGVYNEWLTGDNAYQNYEVGNHQIDTYSEDASMGNAFIVRFTYPLEMFQNGDYPNLIETTYDANRSLPNIYTEEETGETVYVNRLYLNRILDQLQQDFDWDVSEDHLQANGSTVHYYSQELAEIGRVNEIYLFSGQGQRGSMLEIRFTNDSVEGEMPRFVQESLNLNYFQYFAQLLDPELTSAEITQSYNELIESPEDVMLGSLKIKRNGFTANTFSMSRVIGFGDQENYSMSVLPSQEDQVLLAEVQPHYPAVDVLVPSELIYQKGILTSQIANGNVGVIKESENDIQALYEALPTYGQSINISGEVIEWNAPTLILASEDGTNYNIYVEGEMDLTVGDRIEVRGKNLGLQTVDSQNLTVIAESINLNGQVIFSRGGNLND